MDNMNNLYVPVRERIFTLLQAKAMPQKEFAKAIGVSAETITAWKAGRNFSFTNRLDIISQVLGTTTSELLGEEKPTPVSGDGQIGPSKKMLLDMLDGMSEDEAFIVAEMIKAMRKKRQ